MAALRIMPTADPKIPPQTATEMRAYCKAWGIRFSGPALATREYRTGPHPRSAYAHLPMKPTRVTVLAGQVDAFTPMGD